MTRYVPIWLAFNAGELSANMDGRTDQDKYRAGCKTMLNAIPCVQGPARRRGGTRYLGNTKNNGRAWLHKFEYSARQSYALEFGAGYVRFWVSRGQLLNSLNTPYEIVSPITLDMLEAPDKSCAIRSAQMNDVMWIVNANGTLPPQKLQRFGATNWTMTPVDFRWGPFYSVNPQNTIRVSASAATGNVTLSASDVVWDARDVNTYFYLEAVDPGAAPQWVSGSVWPIGTIIRNNGNFYKVIDPTGVASGTGAAGSFVPPTHLVGAQSDGDSAAKNLLQYIHSGFGIVKITAVASDGKSAQGTVIEAANNGNAAAGATPELPGAVVNGGGGVGATTMGGTANATTRWGRSLFNSVDGYPTDVKVFRNRIWYTRDLYHCFSVEGGYDDFSLKTNGAQPTVQSAVVTRTGIDRLDSARWISPWKRAIVGGSLLEASIGEQTINQVFSSTNVKADPETRHGGQFVQPVTAENAILFVQRGGRRVREFQVDETGQNFKADDLNALADHILKPRVTDMDYAQEPNTQLFCVRRDGVVAALTYNRPRNVVGWTRYQLGGKTATASYGSVESVTCIAAPEGDRDDPWLIVQRKVNGQDVRFVEYLEDETLIEDDADEGYFVDAGLTYRGTPATQITGFSHLVGETLAVQVDGTTHKPCVVAADGSITLDYPGSVVHAGLPYRTIIQPMRPDGGAPDGTAQTRIKGYGDVYLRIKDTRGGSFGPSLDRLDPIPYLGVDAGLSDSPAPFTGDVLVTPPAELDIDGWLYIVQDAPQPLTLVAIVPRMEIND